MSPEHVKKNLTTVAAATFEQLVRYEGIAAPKLRRIIRRLKAQGLITTSIEYIRNHNAPAPILTIPKGNRLPPAGPIAYQAALRWGETFEPTLVIRANATLCALYGTDVKHIATGSLSHEISLTEVLWKKRQQQPDFEWQLVRARPGNGALADAVSVSGELMVEVLGRYGTGLAASKISLCARATLELW